MAHCCNRASFYMESLILNHNRFTGTIPSDLGSLMSLKKTILTDNLFSCAGDQPDSRCAAGHLLPCFLQLSSITVPRPDDSNMECPYVEGKPIQQQLLDCESQVNTHMVSESRVHMGLLKLHGIPWVWCWGGHGQHGDLLWVQSLLQFSCVELQTVVFQKQQKSDLNVSSMPCVGS